AFGVAKAQKKIFRDIDREKNFGEKRPSGMDQFPNPAQSEGQTENFHQIDYFTKAVEKEFKH
ncbi:MAG: hypothetical protein U1D33_00260, partial [bacterium]|nr:hypothetical protein [bacterium]